jgi:hypothetical protein
MSFKNAPETHDIRFGDLRTKPNGHPNVAQAYISFGSSKIKPNQRSFGISIFY